MSQSSSEISDKESVDSESPLVSKFESQSLSDEYSDFSYDSDSKSKLRPKPRLSSNSSEKTDSNSPKYSNINEIDDYIEKKKNIQSALFLGGWTPYLNQDNYSE